MAGSPCTHAWPRICDESKQTREQGTEKRRARGRNKWWVDTVVDRETGKTEAGWKAACSDNRGTGPFTSCPRLDDQGRWGERDHVLSKMLYIRDFQLNPFGTSAAFGTRRDMTPIEDVKKQAIKRKEFSQFVLAFMAFGSPVAPGGTRRW